MLLFRSVVLPLGLALGLALAGCGPEPRKKPPTPEAPPTGEQSAPAPDSLPTDPPAPTPDPTPTTPGAEPQPEPVPPPSPSTSPLGAFLRLRPPHAEPPREPEKPVFRIYYDLEGIPDSWIDEWKAGRDLKIEQLPLPTDPAAWPKYADLVIAPPDRLIRDHLRPFPAESPVPRANPVFLHHPFDPDQTLTRPWRWTPWVVMYAAPAEGTPAAPAPKEADLAWPNRPDLLRAWWLKSQQLSANHPLSPALLAKWQAVFAAKSPAPEPPTALWKKISSGECRSALLPLAWKLRQADSRETWTAPATGTLIHFDQLAVGMESDQPELALEWVAFLSEPARQKALTESTGYYPVQRPLGREVPGLTGPPPAWWDRSEFLNGTPPARKIAVRAAIVENPAAPAETTPAAAPNKPDAVKPDPSPAPAEPAR